MIIDFTEVKLQRLEEEFRTQGDELISIMIGELLCAYRDNLINIEWEDGLPVPVSKLETVS